MIEWFVALAVSLWAVVKIYSSVYNYWEKKGFPYAEGRFPFGSSPCLLKPTKFVGFELEEFYYKFKGKLCGGVYLFRRPELIVSDPALIKNILVKDFVHFENRSPATSNLNRPLTQNLFQIEGWRWRPLRHKLTPTFTSGKLKLMYSLFKVCGERFEEKLAKEVNAKGGLINIKDMVGRLTIDIIFSCAFGIDLDSIHNPNDPLRMTLSKLMSSPSKLLQRLESIYATFPKLRGWLDIRSMPREVDTSVINTIASTIQYREENGVYRNDFLDLLMDLKKKEDSSEGGNHNVRNEQDNAVPSSHQKITLDLGMMAAQCFIFIIAGFETSSSVQTFALNELAFHQDLQDKVRNEIDEVSKRCGGVNYQSLQEMKYLDQVISETTRKYPTLFMLTRVCTRPYQIPGTNLVIDKGTRVIIPTYALHHDPEYFPDPKNFDPDRFSESRKSSITPFAYLPFGEGPRNCIGMRFGLLQTKLGIVSILKNFRVFPAANAKSEIEFSKLSAANIITKAEGDIMLELKPL